MKGFIISTCIFITLLICIFINYNYVNSVHTAMCEMVAQLSNETTKENDVIIENLQEYWERKSIILSISVSFREIDDLTNAIDSLSAANELGDNTQFAIRKELVKNAINAVIRLEKISIENIL
ncbi:MAG: DUF4363 family protein [Clostridia bacterium]|nr:DUF4363 family protein [Clostridia bacterium]